MIWVLSVIALFFASFPTILYFRNVTLYRTPVLAKDSLPAVSILIPARNEEQGIADAVAAALASEFVTIEVIVLDDHSTDRTGEIVRSASLRDSRVRLELAPALPAGWCGKQHACFELSRLARYDTFLFVDADVRLTPDGVARMANFLQQSGTDLVSGIPRQITGTVLEKLLIPLIHFLLLGFLPISRMRTSGMPSLGAGCGQLFMATRKGYEKSGGHAVIRESLHDGLKLPRAFRMAGLMTDLFDATDVATCRMYHSAKEVWFGLAKNAREGLASNKLIIPSTIMLLAGQVLPLILLIGFGFEDWLFSLLCLVALAFSFSTRIHAAFRFRQPFWAALLNPISILIVVSIQWFAFVRDQLGLKPTWKGRASGAIKV